MFEFRTIDKLLNGKKPPEDIRVIDKLKESKVLISKILKLKILIMSKMNIKLKFLLTV